uniref:Uncharacterized protein n=1 Tax=Parascaris equorum TaxID=6256 RepID=A0A914S1V7_PAREQ
MTNAFLSIRYANRQLAWDSRMRERKFVGLTACDRACNEYDRKSGMKVKNKELDALLFLQTSSDPRCKDVTVVAFIIYPAAANSFNSVLYEVRPVRLWAALALHVSLFEDFCQRRIMQI